MAPAITSADDAISATSAPVNVPRRPRPLSRARRSMAQLPRCASCSATSSALGAWNIPAMRPAARRMRRSACAAATGSWVTITTVWPSASTTSRRSASTSRPVRVSRAPGGSSGNTTSGRVTSARAIATRCCWPPESCEGRWRRRFSRPTRAATSRTVERRGRRPSRRIGRAMFCATVRDGSRLKAWNTNPIRSRRRIVRRRSLSCARSASPSVTVPEVGRSRPAATLRNVLLPEPEGPMMAVKDPRGSSTLTPSRATTAPSPLPWTLRTSRRATAGAPTAASGESGEEVIMVLDSRDYEGALPSGLHASSCPRAGAAGGGQPYRAPLRALGYSRLRRMIRLMPWAVGGGELVAGRATRARVLAIGRLTAPTHSPWFWLTLWLSVAPAGFIAQIPALSDSGGPVPANEVIHNLSGVSFAACGLIAWRRRPDSGVGPMLTVAGFGVLLPAILGQIDSPLAFTASQLFGELWIALYAALILSFVTGGRLTTKIDVLLVETFIVGLFIVQFAVLLFLPEEQNLLVAWPDAGVANALVKFQWALLAVASLGVVAVTAHRWRVASRPRRRALLPSLGGSLSAALYAANLTALIAGSPSVLLMTALNAALLTVPAALLWGLLRSRLARSGLADLIRELGTLRGATLEAGLAKALDDPSLVLAYRVPGEHSYMDGRGHAVALPALGGECAAAPVERDGRELAMLVYDASLEDDPELVAAVAAAPAIALDDARIQAESEDRLAELRASRERIVAAGDAERRRLERNLHDGAQQRLASVALQLRMIHRQIRTDPAAAERLVTSAGEELSRSLEELRELARGIHPSVLNHGLKAALRSLASRASVPTTVAYEPSGRLPDPVELAAYFVACEALANVAKYAESTRSSVRVWRGEDLACIEIADDGIGGAAATRGSVLRGLADHVKALDGTLRILSPPGAGTVVSAELPCAS